MRTLVYAGEPAAVPRSHPWERGLDESARYYDLKRSPELIREVLEDFLPWQGYAATETLYQLVEALNTPGGKLESNDCAFAGPAPNEDGVCECSGRLMVLFQALASNVTPGPLEALERALHLALAPVDVDFEGGVIATGLRPTRYRALPPGKQQLGSQLMITFWAWGTEEADTMENLDRVLVHLSVALRGLLA